MKKSLLISASYVMFIFCCIPAIRSTAQGIKNTGASINISSGYVVCQGGLDNTGGTVTNNGTLTLAGGISNTGTIEGNGGYNIGANWTNNGTFDAGTGTVTFNGSAAQTIESSSLLTFNNLIIDASSAGTVIATGVPVTVTGDIFDPNGKLTINSAAVNNNSSLIYSGSGTPSGTVTYNRMMPASLYRYISSPVGSSSLPSGHTYWLWDEQEGDWFETSSCESGRGYTVLADDHFISFTGSVLTSLADVPATAPYDAEGVYSDDRGAWGGGGWNLLGNPFTSAMDGLLFISTNSESLDDSYQALYIYDGDDYTYVASLVPGYPAGIGAFSSNDIQAGQGFFVLASRDGVSFDFTGAMRKHNISTSMTKSAEAGSPWPGLQLKAGYGEKEHSTLVVYNDEMTAGLDPGYDVGQLSASPDVKIYTLLAGKDNNMNFTRQALPATDADKIIVPVGIDCEKGGEVTFSAFTILIGTKRFWLEDRITGIFTDLTANSYTVTLPAETYGTGRFYIVASTSTPTAIRQPEAEDTGIRIWTSNGKVIIRGQVSDRAVCEIYDLQGRKVTERCLTDSNLNTVDIPSDLHGVCMVKVTDGLEITSGKVVLL
jgi:hypothetical protein